MKNLKLKSLQLQCINPPSESLLQDIGQLHFGLLDSEISMLYYLLSTSYRKSYCNIHGETLKQTIIRDFLAEVVDCMYAVGYSVINTKNWGMVYQITRRVPGSPTLCFKFNLDSEYLVFIEVGNLESTCQTKEKNHDYFC